MTLCISVAGISDEALVPGRPYRVIVRQAPLGQDEYYPGAEADPAALLVTPTFVAQGGIKPHKPGSVTASRDVFAPQTIGVVLEESRHIGIFSKCASSALVLDSAVLKRASTKAERVFLPLSMSSSQGSVTISFLVSVVTPAELSKAPLRQPVSAVEAAALRQQIAKKKEELRRLQAVDVVDAQAASALASYLNGIAAEVERDIAPTRCTSETVADRIVQLESHLSEVRSNIDRRGQSDPHVRQLLAKEEEACTEQLRKLDPTRDLLTETQMKLENCRRQLSELQARASHRDVASEAVVTLAEHDALQRTIQILETPFTNRRAALAERLGDLQRILNEKQENNDVGHETIPLLDEFDRLTAATAAMESRGGAVIPLPPGLEWTAATETDRALDYLRDLVSRWQAAPRCLPEDIIKDRSFTPSAYPPIGESHNDDMRQPAQMKTLSVDDLFR